MEMRTSITSPTCHMSHMSNVVTIQELEVNIKIVTSDRSDKDRPMDLEGARMWNR